MDADRVAPPAVKDSSSAVTGAGSGGAARGRRRARCGARRRRWRRTSWVAVSQAQAS